MVLVEIIEKAPFTLTDLAEKAGISYDSLRSWSIGRRKSPRLSSREKLASGLRAKARELEQLASDLERAK